MKTKLITKISLMLAFSIPLRAECPLKSWSDEKISWNSMSRYMRFQQEKNRYSIVQQDTIRVEKGQTPHAQDYAVFSFKFLDPHCTKGGSFKKKFFCDGDLVHSVAMLRSCNNHPILEELE